MFVSWAYPPRHTGIGSYTANMADALSGAGHEVVIATGRVAGLPDEELTAAGTVFRCYDQQDIGSRQLAGKLLNLAAKTGADLIECAEFLGEGAEMLRLDGRPPMLIKAHNSGPVRAGREAEIHYGWQRWMQWAAIFRNWRQYKNERYSLQHGDMLVTPSHGLMAELEGQGMRLPRVRTVLPNPIRLPDEPPPFTEAKMPTLLFVGRLAIGKGISYLPAMMESLVRSYPGLQLIIAGGDSYARGIGSLRHWLLKKAGPVRDHMVFTGHQDREALSSLYRDAWMVVVPSRWDTFPTVVLEAMAHAKPVAASTQGGIPEMLDGTMCLPVHPSSAGFVKQIEEMLQNVDLRRKAGLSMFRKAKEQYNPQLIAGKYTRFAAEYLKSRQ